MGDIKSQIGDCIQYLDLGRVIFFIATITGRNPNPNPNPDHNPKPNPNPKVGRVRGLFTFTTLRPVMVVFKSYASRCKQSPITESPLSMDINGVKCDLDKKHRCIPHYLTQSSMDARTLNLGNSVFLYTGTCTIRDAIG